MPPLTIATIIAAMRYRRYAFSPMMLAFADADVILILCMTNADDGALLYYAEYIGIEH